MRYAVVLGEPGRFEWLECHHGWSKESGAGYLDLHFVVELRPSPDPHGSSGHLEVASCMSPGEVGEYLRIS